ncbi:hypothetical protein AAFF_G00280380 [Aldrovandia affinis]|uniref:Uncharacterized protein n=1 Tax=Aldrovandia affinis TaxID=143900 RepID=A0AAD7RA37_9TELE|nr:hypothetical protein AAFF_G00280380 [Aldrovandia affinis]
METGAAAGPGPRALLTEPLLRLAGRSARGSRLSRTNKPAADAAAVEQSVSCQRDDIIAEHSGAATRMVPSVLRLHTAPQTRTVDLSGPQNVGHCVDVFAALSCDLLLVFIHPRKNIRLNAELGLFPRPA